MEQEQAEETLKAIERLRSSTAAKARSWSTPLFAWATAALGSVAVSELSILFLGQETEPAIENGRSVIVIGPPSNGRAAIPVGIYWLVAGVIATLVSVRAYRQQAVHPEPRPPSSPTEKLIFVVLLVFFAPGALTGLLITGVFGGTWPFLAASVWMMIVGKAIRNDALHRVAMYSILVLPLAAFVPDHACTVAAGVYFASLGITAEVLRRGEIAAA